MSRGQMLTLVVPISSLPERSARFFAVVSTDCVLQQKFPGLRTLVDVVLGPLDLHTWQQKLTAFGRLARSIVHDLIPP